ncbi:MAG: PQQ-binding-like beta-propeller repeat protein [Candidatus Aminicenantaceae bacterium]
MKRQVITFTLMLAVLSIAGFIQAEDNWPHWRGPHHNGISGAINLPMKWSATENIVWKIPLPSWSAATPIIWGDRIFITSPSKSEPKPEPEQKQVQEQSQTQRRRRRSALDPGGPKLLLLCISKKDGKILWERELDDKNQIHRKQNDATPSPVTDGKHVWAVTGTGKVAAYDMNGKPVWMKDLQKDYGPFGHNWGYGSSPLLHDGSLIVEVLHGMKTDDPSYIVSLNATTGEVQWHQERPTDAEMESPDAYTTPVLLKNRGDTQIVISGGDYVTGHDFETGKEIWRAAGLNPLKRRNYRIVPTPIIVDGIIYAPTRKKPLLALKVGGTGDITESHLVWKYEGSAAPDVPSPVSDGKYFYMVDDRGLVTSLDAKTGTLIWGPETTTEGIVSASPILVDGKLYIINEKGVTSIVSVGPEFKLLATNELDGSYTLASPAVSGSQLFIRTSTHLYCIEKE